MSAEESGAFYRAIVESLYDAVYVVDRERRIVFWNRGAEQLTGHAACDVIGHRCADGVLNHVDADGRCLCSADVCPAEATMREDAPREAQVFLLHHEGHRVPVVTRIAPIHAEDGSVVGAVEVFADDSQRAAMAEQNRQLAAAALMDPLTGVGNRRFGELRLKGLFSELERYAWPLALAFVDIDRFKSINDTYGHKIGDAVLSAVAKTMVGCLRASDLVVRWGGEEFVLVLRNVEGEVLEAVLEKVRRMVAETAVSAPGGPLRVTVSIGGTAARAGDMPDTLVARADALMYRSKREGRDRVCVA